MGKILLTGWAPLPGGAGLPKKMTHRSSGVITKFMKVGTHEWPGDQTGNKFLLGGLFQKALPAKYNKFKTLFTLLL